MSVSELAHLFDAERCPLLVVKIGSALLVEQGGDARRDWLGELVDELASLHRAGQHIVIVSSGAVALGAARLELPGGGRSSLADAQAAAAVGQIALAGLWSDKFAGRGLPAAQLLLTLDDLEDRRRYLNASTTLRRLLDTGAVPVVNENDSVATEEIRFGDNDRLAARVAQACGAGGVLLLSDVDGLYDRDPDDPDAVLQPRVTTIDKRVEAMARLRPGEGKDASGTAAGMGTGGMASKLEAARIATRAGIALAVVNGRAERPIARARSGGRGTLFPVPRDAAARSMTARHAWLSGKLDLRGSVRIDRGCVEALKGGGSLLAAGIVAVEGEFARGDAIAISGPNGGVLAHGLSEYDAKQVRAIRGKRSDMHLELLGQPPRAAVVHRDHLVML